MRRRQKGVSAGGGSGGGGDPLFADVRLLLHMDGTNGSQTFTDVSPTPKTCTAQGTVNVATAAPKFGTGAALYDGTTDAITCGVLADWRFLHEGTPIWTFECWAQADNFAAERGLIDTTAGTTTGQGIFVSVSAARAINVVITRAVGASFVLNASFAAAFPNDTAYHHIRVVYDHSLGTGNCLLYVDGVAAGSANKTGNAPAVGNPSNVVTLGALGPTFANSWLGKIDDVRITAAARSDADLPITEAFPDS